MSRLTAFLLLFICACLGVSQTFIVTNSGPASGLTNDELVYDITIQTNNPQGVQNIEFGAFIRTTPTPNGWNTVTSTSSWGVGGWQGNGDVVYTTFFLGKGNVVNVQVRVHCDPGFEGDLSVEAYARLSGGFTVRKQVITKVGPMKVRILDAVTGQPLAGPELQPSVLRLNSSLSPLSMVRRRCKVEVEAPTLPGRYFRAYVVPNATSGGHDHPTPTDRLHGWLLAWTSGDPNYPLTGPSAQPGTLQTSGYEITPYRAYLDGFGKAQFQYVAPEISGTESIVVVTEELLEPDRYYVPTDVRVRVPSLVPVIENENLELYSSDVNTEHHARGALSGRYFVTEAMRQAIEALAINFKADLGTKLKVNDASLVDGGLFDISGQWAYPHIGHRAGIEFDLGGVATPNSTVERIAREQGWWTVPGPEKKSSLIVEGTHYHFILRGQGTPYMALQRYRTSWHDQANRILKVEMDFLNKGGADAVTNVISSATSDDNRVTVQSGTGTDFGSASIRQPRTATLLMHVPGAVSQFLLTVRGVSTLQSQPNHPFVGDLQLGGLHGVGYYLLPITPGTPKLRSFVLTQYSSLPPNSMGAGQPIGARVSLNGPAVTPTVVNLTSSNPGAALVPPTVTIPVGQAYRNFTITTSKVPPQAVSLTASSGSVTLPPVTLNLLATIQSATFSPSSVKKGLPTTLTVVFTGTAAPGTTLYLNVPSDRFVVPGSTQYAVGGLNQIQIPLTTKTAGNGTVTCTLNLNKVQATVTITP